MHRGLEASAIAGAASALVPVIEVSNAIHRV
jgi:hypothetical protein